MTRRPPIHTRIVGRARLLGLLASTTAAVLLCHSAPPPCCFATPPPRRSHYSTHLPGSGGAAGIMSFETGAYQDAVATLNPAGAPHPAPGDPSFAVRVKPVEAVFTLSLSDSCAIPNHLSVQVRLFFFFLLHVAVFLFLW